MQVRRIDFSLHRQEVQAGSMSITIGLEAIISFIATVAMICRLQRQQRPAVSTIEMALLALALCCSIVKLRWVSFVQTWDSAVP